MTPTLLRACQMFECFRAGGDSPRVARMRVWAITDDRRLADLAYILGA